MHSVEHFKSYILILALSSFALCPAKAQQPVRNLDYFYQEAVKRSPLLKDYKNQLQSNRIDSMRVKAGYLPQVTGIANGMYAPVINGYGFDEVLTNGKALEAALNVNYNLVSKRNINNQLESIHLQSDSIRFATGISTLDLQKAITDQYITAFASQQQAAFNREVYQLLHEEETVLKKLTRANVYKQVDYLTFLVTFQQQQLQWKQAELQLKNDYSTLNYLTGIADTTAHELEDPGIEPVSSNTGIDFFGRRFGIDSLKLINQRKAIDFNYKPKASVYANGGYNSSFAFQPYRNFGTSVGFTVSVPIFDGHQRKMQYNKLAIAQRTINGYKEFFQNQHMQQLNLLRQQISDQTGLYKQVSEQIKFTKSLIQVDSRLLQTGDIRIADFVIAINNYLAAQNLMRQTNITRLKLVNQLNYWNR
ncbi:outer membrane protein TolC [Pedobacter cryoconitis]|uniref:Outer membrane protein TolC n=1 Tax=Pedobacter cryoconitis TaxID=188932 RepID=A0A7W8ZP68_9SPHI|nr:outer membrane protein TolC [Pedobacter cryoconitis]MBB6270061.1 outer membrane protein TolC [Pedobacter cryoconitis]